MRWLGPLWVLALLLQSVHTHRFAELPPAFRGPLQAALATPGDPGHDSDHCPACQMAGTRAEALAISGIGLSPIEPTLAWHFPPNVCSAVRPFVRSSPPRAPPCSA